MYKIYGKKQIIENEIIYRLVNSNYDFKEPCLVEKIITTVEPYFLYETDDLNFFPEKNDLYELHTYKKIVKVDDVIFSTNNDITIITDFVVKEVKNETIDKLTKEIFSIKYNDYINKLKKEHKLISELLKKFGYDINEISNEEFVNFYNYFKEMNNFTCNNTFENYKK